MLLVTIESPPQLEFIKNGEITPIARLAHELIQSDRMLRNHTDPDVLFAMSPEMIIDHSERRTERLDTLGIEASESDVKIYQISCELEALGIFPHRAFPEAKNPNADGSIELTAGRSYAVPLGNFPTK